MSLARAWRRQLYGASSAALIVPSAMLAALIVLALGGGFSQVGVLGQIFAGPSAPAGSGGTAAGGSTGVASHALPAIPSAAVVARTRGEGRTGAAPGPGRVVRGGVNTVALRSPSQTGGAIAPVGGIAPIVSAAPRPAPPAPAPAGSGSSQPPSKPGPSPKPTVVDRIVKTLTPITRAVPAPVGPAATQAVQAAGSAADGLLPLGAPVRPSSLKVP